MNIECSNPLIKSNFDYIVIMMHEIILV